MVLFLEADIIISMWIHVSHLFWINKKMQLSFVHWVHIFICAESDLLGSIFGKTPFDNRFGEHLAVADLKSKRQFKYIQNAWLFIIQWFLLPAPKCKWISWFSKLLEQLPNIFSCKCILNATFEPYLVHKSNDFMHLNKVKWQMHGTCVHFSLAQYRFRSAGAIASVRVSLKNALLRCANVQNSTLNNRSNVVEHVSLPFSSFVQSPLPIEKTHKISILQEMKAVKSMKRMQQFEPRQLSLELENSAFYWKFI